MVFWDPEEAAVVARWWAEQWRATVRRRTGEVRMLVVMLLVCAIAAALGALVPMTPAAPVRLIAALAVVGFTMALAVWSRPSCAPWRLIGPAVVVAGVAGIVAAAATPGGTATATLGFVWVVLYTALFCSRGTARAYVGLIAAALAAALTVNPFPGSWHTFAYVVLTAAAAGEALSGTVHRLHRLAVTDPLTGLLNREGLRRATAAVLLAAERSGDDLTVAVLDLDGFKAVNDVHGHAAGDALLVQLSHAWSGELRPSDLLGRWGGDEFVLVLPGTDLASARATVRRLAATSTTGWSYGLAPYRSGSSLDALLHDADADLYRAKSRRAASAREHAQA
jgi:diguanylate cyclase (GGDEF)-like protein